MSTLFTTFPPPSVQLLLAWFRARDVFLDVRLELRETTDSGWAVFACEAINLDETICRTPKAAMFSRRTSSLDVSLGPGSELLPPTHVLALHLLHEVLLGPKRTPFSGYLQSLPRDPPPIAMLWETWAGKDGKRAWPLARSGEIGRRLRASERSLGKARVGGREVEWGAGGIASLKRFYDEFVLPTLLDAPLLAALSVDARRPTFDTFLHAYALVSSRCFTIDTYHQISLVPLADIFNHSPDHQAHFTVDEFVCGTCGSLVPCSHDAPRSGPGVLPARLAHLHEFEERDLLAIFSGADSGDICANSLIEAGDEVFNSYGNLSSAHLACEYGFVPDEAGTLPEDRVHFDLDPPVSSASTIARSVNDSLFAARPHPLVEPSVLSAHLSPDDRLFVSADGQLSEALFLALAERAELAERTEAVEVLHDAGEFLTEKWGRLRSAVISALDAKLATHEGQEALLDLLEDEAVGPLTHMASTLALAERATLDACRSQWLEAGGEEARES